MSKKLVSVALTASTVVWGLGLATLPLANAQTSADLQAQIAALLQQIQTLQSRLGQPGGSTAPTSYNFTRNLTLGSKGPDVTALQQLLASKGYLTASPTGYFGALTKAALVKFQVANRITPAAGYFGPKTRAFVNSMVTTPPVITPPVITPPVITPPVITPPTSTSTPPVATSTTITVSLSPNNPIAAGSLITSASGAGAARVPVLAANFTAGTKGAVTVTDIKFRKTGYLSDGAVAGAYLTVGGKVIAQYNSINQGVMTFSGLNWQIPAGATQEIVLAIDVAGGLSAGSSMGFSLNSAADINSYDAGNNLLTEQGNFPLTGNTFTVTLVSNPSLAALTITSSSIGTQVTAGTQSNLVGAWNFSASNNKIWLKNLNFRVIGSANKGDLRNVKLMVNGTQAGATLAAVGQDGTAYFDASANPGALNTGSNNVQIFADIAGSPSYNFQFEVLNAYDVLAVDSVYNVPIAATNTGGVGTQVTIKQGQITVTQNAGTPTGNIAKGQSQIPLAKFNIYAAGEAVRVKFLDFAIVFTGAGATTSLSSQIQNVALVDDAGGQVGTTINTPPSSNVCTGFGAAASYAATTTYSDCFGTSASQVNYVVPPNTTRVLTLKADIQSTANFTSLVASLSAETGKSNLQGLTSSQVADSGAASGGSLTLANASLTVAQNAALGNQNVSKGTMSQKIGSYAFTASTAEGVNVQTVSVQANGGFFSNLKIQIGSTLFGSASPGTVASGTISSITGTPFNVPAGSTVNVDVYADILSSATASTTFSPATILTGYSGSGAISLTALSLATSVNGQNLTVSGQSTVTVTADSSAVAQVVMGSTGNSLAVFRFAETSNVENVKITNLNVIDSVTATSTVKQSFSNLTLWTSTSTAPVSTAGTPAVSASGTAYIYTFNFTSPIVIPQAGQVALTLKGDASTWISGAATDNSVHTFKIATTTDATLSTTALAVVALGNTSNATSSVTLSNNPSGGAQTILRNKLTFATSPLGQITSRAKQNEALATLTFAANGTGSIALNSITATFSGTAPSISTFLAGVTLRDDATNVITVSATSTACNGSNTCTVSWNLGAGSSGRTITLPVNYTLWVDSSKTMAGIAQVTQNLVATIAAVGDITYSDAGSGDTTAATGLTLPSSVITPINLNAVSYVTGQ